MANYDYQKMADTAKKISDHLKKKGITSSIKTSRYQTQIKALEVAYPDSLEKLLKVAGIIATIGDLTNTEEKAISGKYKAKLIKITTASGGAVKGETFFLVNTYTEKGTLKTKDLAPDKLGLTTASGYSSLASFDKAVYDGIEKLKVSSEIKTALEIGRAHV